MTRGDDTPKVSKDRTVTPPSENPTDIQQLMSPHPNDPPFGSQNYGDMSQTQRFSQGMTQIPTSAYEVPNEEQEGVWGYLVPVDGRLGFFEPVVLKDRHACTPSNPDTKENTKVSKHTYTKQEENIEKSEKCKPAKGYLIGRHPECGKSSLLVNM
jgi:serine/threonine-protein kinase CHEK2